MILLLFFAYLYIGPRSSPKLTYAKSPNYCGFDKIRLVLSALCCWKIPMGFLVGIKNLDRGAANSQEWL
jgi:hypothetical protein